MKKPTAIIIGAGVGGLSTAIQLAKKGFEVTIFEKDALPGGRCRKIVKDGHIFDTGPTMYLFPQIYKEFFSSIGEEISQHLKLIKVDPTYQLNYSDNTKLILTSDFKLMQNQLEKLEPGSYQSFLKYLDKGKVHFDLAINKIAKQSLDHPKDYFNLKNLYPLLKSLALRNHYSYTKRFFKHPFLNMAFTFQDSYLSLNPYQTPAIYSLFTYSELTEGSFLPKGGMHQVILALEKIAKKHKVKIYYQTPVKKINISEDKAVGVTLENKTVKEADFIIANADLSYAYQKLLPQEPQIKKLLNKKYSCSAIIFHWGLNKAYSELKAHNLFFSDNYKEGFEQVINHPNPPLTPHFYIQSPAKVDSSRAPKNQDTVSIIVPINHIYPQQPINWEKYVKSVRKYILKRLIKIGLKDIEEHIKFEIVITPKDWQNKNNLMYGSIYGLHHNLTQVGYFRPNRQHKKYKNLFFVGASTHPGSGIPTVLLSSKFTSQQILSQKRPNITPL